MGRLKLLEPSTLSEVVVYFIEVDAKERQKGYITRLIKHLQNHPGVKKVRFCGVESEVLRSHLLKAGFEKSGDDLIFLRLRPTSSF